MTEAEITRVARIPDSVRLSRYRRAPELGPSILFFSGGSAIRKLSRVLKTYSHNTIHLITPFDSGGSSAKLRDAFDMLSVGDLRNRLIALADETVRGNPEIYALFTHRLSEDAAPDLLRTEMAEMARGDHPLVAAVPMPLQGIVCTQLAGFLAEMPEDFDLRGANIGNLALVGDYLGNGHDIEAVLFRFSALVAVQGTVAPVANANLHLRAELADGTDVIGQHRLTGKETAPIAAPIADLHLVEALTTPEPAHVAIHEKTRGLIQDAEMICYPPGSFWTSVIANLLPAGVGRAIAHRKNPKIFVPNSGVDPEAPGLSISKCVECILRKVRQDAGADTPVSRILTHVLVDSAGADYGDRFDPDRLQALGVQVIDAPLVSEASRPLLHARRLAEALLSIV